MKAYIFIRAFVSTLQTHDVSDLVWNFRIRLEDTIFEKFKGNFFYVSCPFKSGAITAFNNFMSFIILSNFRRFTVSHCSWFDICSLKLVKYVNHYFPMFLLLSACPVSIKFSRPSFLILSQIFEFSISNSFFSSSCYIMLKHRF